MTKCLVTYVIKFKKLIIQQFQETNSFSLRQVLQTRTNHKYVDVLHECWCKDEWIKYCPPQTIFCT
jgi:hypothetical protein